MLSSIGGWRAYGCWFLCCVLCTAAVYCLPGMAQDCNVPLRDLTA
jgi:hypothetical protein